MVNGRLFHRVAAAFPKNLLLYVRPCNFDTVISGSDSDPRYCLGTTSSSKYKGAVPILETRFILGINWDFSVAVLIMEYILEANGYSGKFYSVRIHRHTHTHDIARLGTTPLGKRLLQLWAMILKYPPPLAFHYTKFTYQYFKALFNQSVLRLGKPIFKLLS